MAIWYIFCLFGIFFVYLVYFLFIWYIFCLFGVFYCHLVYLYRVGILYPKKNLATLVGTSEPHSSAKKISIARNRWKKVLGIVETLTPMWLSGAGLSEKSVQSKAKGL
jgi:hypothetical protein